MASFSPMASYFLAQMGPQAPSLAPLVFGINSLPAMFTRDEMNTVLAVSKDASKAILPLQVNRLKKNPRKERRWDPKAGITKEYLDQSTRIFHAVKTHNIPRVLELVEVGADLTLKTLHDESLLFVAAYSKAPAEILKALFNATYWGETEVYKCFSHACYAGAPASSLEVFLPYCHTDLKYFSKIHNRHSPLHWMCRAGMDHSFIPTLIASSPGMVTALCDHYGQLPLHLALWHNLPLHVMKMLVEPFPHTIHIKDLNGKSPLDMAKNPQWKVSPETLEYFLSLP